MIPRLRAQAGRRSRHFCVRCRIALSNLRLCSLAKGILVAGHELTVAARSKTWKDTPDDFVASAPADFRCPTAGHADRQLVRPRPRPRGLLQPLTSPCRRPPAGSQTGSARCFPPVACFTHPMPNVRKSIELNALSREGGPRRLADVSCLIPPQGLFASRADQAGRAGHATHRLELAPHRRPAVPTGRPRPQASSRAVAKPIRALTQRLRRRPFASGAAPQSH